MKDAVAITADAWREGEPEARWIAPDNFHITVKFLGETGRADEIGASLQRLSSISPFEMALSGPGAFPTPSRARVLWLGFEDPSEGFRRLAQRVEEELVPLGFSLETRPLTPHITLARIPRSRAVSFPAAPPRIAFTIDRVVLFRSHLERGGARYESIDEVELSGSP